MPDRFQTRRFTPTLQKALELKAQKEYEKNITAQSQPQTVQPESKASTGERVLATVGDFFGNIITGAAKGIEGIIDLGASVVGGVGGLFDQDFQNDVQDWVSNDWVGENIGNPIQEGTKASYLNDSKAGEIIEGIASGVGQMLPSIALTVATGGAAAPGMAVMAASAAGNATEEAYNQGAGYGQGLAYGVLSGVVEAATEKIGGVVLGGGTSLVGKKLAGTALGKATSKGIGKVAETFVSEGAEEVLSDLANPALKYVTGVDKNIGQNYVDAFKGLPETFVVGGGAGAILGGGQNFVQRARNRNRGGANATRADALLAYAQELTENYSDDIVQNKRYDNAVHQIYEQASEEIKKMKPEQRQKYLRSIGSQALAFNEDGSLRAKQAINYNAEAMTASLRPVSGNLTFAPVQSNVAVNENAKQIKNVIEGVKKGAKVVVTDGLQGSNAAYYPEDDVFYVNNRVGEEDSNGTDTNNSGIKKLDNSLLNAIALHELTHKGEGTKAYNALAREISRLVNDPNAPDAIKAKLGDYEARLAWTKEAYANQGKTQAQKEYVVQTEMISDYLGDLLSDEYFVRKLGERNKSVTKRILSALEGLARGENKNVDPSVKKGLRKLYKAYVNTLDRAGYGVLVSEIDKEEIGEERGETTLQIDTARESRYNKNSLIHKTFPSYQESGGSEANTLAVWWAHRADIKAGDKNLISYNGEWYVIEKFDSSDLGYQIIEKITENQYQAYLEEFENGDRQKQSVPKSVNSITSLDRRRNSSVGEQQGIDSSPAQHGREDRQVQREGKERSQRGKTTSDRGRDSKGGSASEQRKSAITSVKNNSRTSKKDDGRHSLARKDSEGKVLSQGQRDFFKDSKVRDKEGNLLVAYHGSPNVFDEFDLSRAGENTGSMWGDGIYLTTNENVAVAYTEGKHGPIKAYVNLVNPLILGERDVVSELRARGVDIDKYMREQGQSHEFGLDLTPILKAEGYDGIFDESSGTIVAYESNQIKLTTNHTPTKSGNMRFSLKANGENISGEAEIKGDLVALHNLDERKLMKVLELGGFPMPSIAITRASLGHDQYGKITVVFGRETIDPQANRKNKVYPRDVWSPTVPKAEYKANEKVEDKIHKKYYELARKYGYDAVRPWYKYISDMEQQLANHEGEAGILEDMYDDASVMEIYLLDTEGKMIEPEKIVEQDRMSEEDVAYSKALLERFGDELRVIETGHFGQVRKFITDNREALIECLSKADSENHGKAYFEDADRLKQTVGRALRYRDNGPVTERVKFDYAKKESEVRKSVDKEKYKEWVDSYFKGIEEKKGVRNDVDVFTRSGNRRSFEATHEDYTLENIVDIMRQETQQGNSGWVGTTPSVLAAKLADEFASVEAIREAASSLKEFNEEMQENFNEVVRGMLTDISTLMTEGKRYIDDVERMTSMDSAERVIGEIADKRLFTEKQIADYMRREYPQSYTYTKEIGEKMISMFQYVRSMSDTDYFEAKPRRAVGLDEIKAVLLPDTASERVKNALTDKGIQYTQYDAADVNARRDLIEKMENVRFSRRSNSVDMYTQEQYNDFGWVRANEVLTYRQWSDFNHKFENKTEEVKRRQTKNGEYMIAVNDMKDKKFGVDNVIVFAKGTPLHPVVTKIIEINLEYETLIEAIREVIYEHEGNIDKGVFDGVLQIYNSKDFAYSTQQSGRGQAIEIDSPLRNGRRGTRSDSDDGDDGNKGDKGRHSRVKSDKHKFYYEMSRGEIKKLLANNTRMRVYAKKDIEQIINTVLDSYMSFGDKYGTLSNKNKAQVVDSLWQALNTAEKGKVGAVAIDAAEFIINSAVAEEMYEDYDRYEDVAIVNILRPYLNRINLDGIKGELLYIYDKEGFRAIRGRWGKRSDVTKFGIAPDELKLLLEDEGFHMAAEHPADVLAEVDSQYTNALARLKAKSKELFKDMLSAEEMKKLRQDITREILIAADEKGAPSKLSKILEKYKKQLDAVKRRYDEVRHKNGAVNLLLDRVQKIKDIKSGAFLNATQYKSDLFKGSIEKLGRIKYRGNLNRVGTRKIFAALSEWYNAGNPMFKGMDGDQNGLRSNGVFNQEIKDMLDAIAQNEKPLTAAQEKTIAELEKKSGITDYAKLAEWYTRANVGTTYSSEVKRMLNELARPTEYSLQEVYAMQKIVQYFTHIIETYNMVLKNGKYVDAKELATRYIEKAEKAKKVKTGVVDRIVQSRYGQAFMDPLSIMRNADRYDEHGFFTETFFELQEGIIRSQKLENDLKKDFEEFFKSHKKYAQDLSERKVKYNGVEMSLDEALSLYMTLNREQAQAGLVYSGLSFEERSGKRLGKQSKPVHVKGLVGKDVTGLTPEEIEQTAKAARDDLAKQFNETDMQFVAMLEKALNEDCKEIKRKTDTQRMGYSNVQEGYYYPIRRGYVASNVDSFNAQFEIDRVSNASFNKDTVKGAKGELYIEPVTRVFERHVRGIAQYAGLSTFIDNYNMLYNIDIGDNPNNVNNIRKTAEEVWKNNSQYIIKMLSDAQGIRKLDVGDKIIQRIRGAYVKFALGANPKVWLTQTTSLLAATSVLDVKNVVKGLSVKGADVDTYCDLAEIRNHDNTIALAQGVIDSIGKVGDFLMKPIGMVDRWVVKKLFGACQYQIQQNGGAKVGTIENKKAAGELLTRVILQTQQNSMVTERSSAMRSNSEVARTLTMFTSDAMKVIGRVVDAIGEYTVLKKNNAGADKMKAARRKTVKAVGALVSTSVFMALIAQAFKTLYNKDDEDENIAENMAVDMLGNMLGGLPLIKDVYARLMEGYEVSNYAYSTINNLLDSANNIFQAASDWISGDVDSKQTARNIKNMIYAAGQLLGIPVRNIYNVFYGLISRFSASSAYKLDDLFYNQSYSSDLRKAIEEDDDEMASTIIGLMLNENIGDVTNENVRTELDRLVKSGHDVIPRSAPNSITYEGEEITLTAAQKRDFKQVYSEANNELASLVRLSAYRSASDDVKAKAVDIVYEMYYDLAVEDLIGEDLETKTVLFSKAFDIGKLALIVAQARLLTADKDDSGRAINGTKKAKIQSYINSLNLSAAEKYMIMGYLGYSNTYGEAQVQRYLRGIRGLTSTQRQLLLEYSGYAA